MLVFLVTTQCFKNDENFYIKKMLEIEPYTVILQFFLVS